MNSPVERLQHVRELAGLSARRLGALAGLSPATVAMIEAEARRTPAAETMMKLAGTLGVSLDWLLRGEGPEPEEGQVLEAVRAAEQALTARQAADAPDSPPQGAA